MEQICSTCLSYMTADPHNIGWLKCPSCDFRKKTIKSMITKKEVLMGRDEEYPLTEELETNLSNLLIAVNKLRELYGKPMYVSSGYRPGKYNEAAKGAKNSAHLTCEAVDFKDGDGELKKWITVEILEQCNLYMEDPSKTVQWCHLQIRPTKSGNRIFKI